MDVAKRDVFGNLGSVARVYEVVAGSRYLRDTGL